MELRSSSRKVQYSDLKFALQSMGFYEEGMELQEMQELLQAIQKSVIPRESFVDVPLKESELEFLGVPSHAIHNSTMISSFKDSEVDHAASSSDMPNTSNSLGQRIGSPCSSPETGAKYLTVHAIVHHPMDWSPTRPNAVIRNSAPFSYRKGYLAAASHLNNDSAGVDSSSSIDMFASSSSSVPQSDSGLNWSNSSVSTSNRDPFAGEEMLDAPTRFVHLFQASSSSVAVSDYRNSSDESEDMSLSTRL